MRHKRRLAVIVGSDSDLKSQCIDGLRQLKAAADEGTIEVIGVYTASIHHNTVRVLSLLEELDGEADVLIVGAGWANHLTGTVDAYLRHHLKNTSIVVIGVAFADMHDQARTMAATMSIQYVPDTQVVIGPYVGSLGFTKACCFAIRGKLPEITLPNRQPDQQRSLEAAMEFSQAA